MHIVYEHGNEKFPDTIVGEFGDKNARFYHYPKSLFTLIREQKNIFIESDVVLVNEQECTFFQGVVTIETHTPLTTQKIHQHVEEYMRKEGKSDIIRRLARWFWSWTMVDGVYSSSPLGKTGTIVISLCCVSYSPLLREHIQHIPVKNRPFFAPRSFFTLHFLQHTLQKNSFHLLYFFEQEMRLITYTEGWYAGYHTLNVGWGMMKDACVEEGLDENDFCGKNEHTSVTKELLRGIHKAFFDHCGKRLSTYLIPTYDIILISAQSGNSHLISSRQTRLKSVSQGFFLPFRSSGKIYTPIQQEDYRYDPEIAAQQFPSIAPLIFGGLYPE